jgi:hypothetical protein
VNEEVLSYLEVERVTVAGTNTAWVIDGYSLSTHPDLCERVKEINEAAGVPARFGYAYGRPVLTAANGVIVAFAAGTHIFCVRVPISDVDSRVVVAGEPKVGEDWTRVDPWTIEIPKAEGLEQLALLVRLAVENAGDGNPAPAAA